jgi:Putative prokaryotic signal transducing protein
MSHSHLVVVQAFATEMEAVIARSALESAGIVASIRSDSAGGMRPHLGWSTGGYELLVREEDEDTAREILNLPDDSEGT